MYLSNKARKVLYADETWKLRAEYKKMTGESFPLFNYEYWHSIDEWLTALKTGIEEARKRSSNKTTQIREK